jgi:hypothetical protein
MTGRSTADKVSRSKNNLALALQITVMFRHYLAGAFIGNMYKFTHGGVDLPRRRLVEVIGGPVASLSNISTAAARPP